MDAEYDETSTNIQLNGWERGPSRGSVKPTMNFHITESDEEFDREKATVPEPVDIKSPK